MSRHKVGPIKVKFDLPKLYSLAIELKLESKVKKIHVDCIGKTLSELNIFDSDPTKKIIARSILSDLLWSRSTQQQCIDAMNDLTWSINLSMIKRELFEPMTNCYLYVHLILILKFIGQFTTDSNLYNGCLAILNKLDKNEDVVHMIAFNKKFRPTRSLIPPKLPGLNRITHFNPSYQIYSIDRNILYWENRILYVFKLIYDEIHQIVHNHASLDIDSLRSKQLYLLVSVIEFTKITDPLFRYDKFIDLTYILKSLRSICKKFRVEFFDQKSFNIFRINLVKFINESDQVAISTNSESDLLEQTKLNINIIDLLDADINGDNETEIKFIIDEMCKNFIVGNVVEENSLDDTELLEIYWFILTSITITNKELADAFWYLIDNDLMSQNNLEYLNESVIKIQLKIQLQK